MKFSFLINKNALHIAVEKGNTEIIQLLLSHQDTDVNVKTIINCF